MLKLSYLIIAFSCFYTGKPNSKKKNGMNPKTMASILSCHSTSLAIYSNIFCVYFSRLCNIFLKCFQFYTEINNNL